MNARSLPALLRAWLAALFGIFGIYAASAGGYRNSPTIANDPSANITNLWAWVQPGTHDKLQIVVAYIPFEEPGAGPNFYKFADDVAYDIHIARGPNSLADVVKYRIQFSTTPIIRVDPANLNAPLGGGKEFFSQLSGQTQTYKVTKIQGGVSTVIASNLPVAPPRIGPLTDTAVDQVMNYDDNFAATFIKTMGTLGAEGRVWAGPRDDGYYGDLGAFSDLLHLHTIFGGSAVNGLAGFNCHAIALEIPTTKLTADGNPPGVTPGDATTLGVWASTSRRRSTMLRKQGGTMGVGPFVQVDRMGFPFTNTWIIGLQDKDKFARTAPASDLTNFANYFLSPVIVRDAQAVGFYSAGGPLAGIPFDQVKSNRVDIIGLMNLGNIPTVGAHHITSIGDVLRVDMATDSSFPNGRPIPGSSPNKENTDVTDVMLSILLTGGPTLLPDGANYNDKNYLTQFPWLPLPWRAFDEGHGKTTP